MSARVDQPPVLLEVPPGVGRNDVHRRDTPDSPRPGISAFGKTADHEVAIGDDTDEPAGLHPKHPAWCSAMSRTASVSVVDGQAAP